MVSTFCIYGKAPKPSRVYVKHPWIWQEPLEVTSDELRHLILKNNKNRDDISLDICRPFPQNDWGLVFDSKAKKRFQPKMISIESRDSNFDVFGNFIIAGIDKGDKLRGLFQQDVDIILSLQPNWWKPLVESTEYPDPESSQ